jgi:hypothetical protein
MPNYKIHLAAVGMSLLNQQRQLLCRCMLYGAVGQSLGRQVFSKIFATSQLSLLFNSGKPTAAVCSIAACQLQLFVQKRHANCRCWLNSGMPTAAVGSMAACQLPLLI